MNRSQRAAVLALSALVLASGAAAASEGASSAAPMELLVRFERGANQRAALAAVGASVVDRSVIPGLVRIRLAPDAAPAAVEAELEWRNDVRYVAPNRTYQLFATPDDSLWPNLWGMTKIKAPDAWDKQTGSPAVTVAVVDTGVDMGHEDLVGNVWQNAAEAGGSAGVDDDGNGLMDDVNGWDFFDSDDSPADESSVSHGTHVAGTIGARGNNGLGVAGVNWNVKLMALRVGDDDGLDEFAIANSFAYACGKGARVVNGSFGGTYSAPIHDAMSLPACANTVFVFAAGNGGIDGIGDSNDVAPQYPCNDAAPNIICVAATTTTDARAGFSNYGVQSVDVGAPGTSIASTTAGDTYGFLQGTSMAAPHVAGAAALVLAERPALNAAELRNAVLLSADAVPGLAVATGGRLNVARALGQEVVPPAGLTASSSTHPPGVWTNKSTVTLSWGGATDANGIDGYSYTFSPVPTFAPDEVKDVEETTTSLTMPLPDGEHWFHVRARDGSGNWGAPVHVGPLRIDTFAPVKPVASSSSHAVGGASADRTVDVAWSGSTDSASGVDGFSFSWTQGRPAAADQTKNVEETVFRTTSPQLAVGAWWFNIRARDNAGNWSDSVSVGPFSLRSTPAACSVPRLRGLTLRAAKRLLVKRGCALGTVSRVRSRRVARGRVVGQRPAPGLRLRRGARVRVSLSRGR